jgi:phage regulator Rha-like protein
MGCCVEYDKLEKERADVQRAEAALARKRAALKQSIHMSNQYRLPAKATSTVKGTMEKAGWKGNKRMQRAKRGTRLAQMNANAAKPVEDSWQEIQ